MVDMQILKILCCVGDGWIGWDNMGELGKICSETGLKSVCQVKNGMKLGQNWWTKPKKL